MIIVEEIQHLVEILQPVRQAELQILKNQMFQNAELLHTLNTPIRSLPDYQFLTDDPIFSNATLFQIIEGTSRLPNFECYFMKTSRGIYVGFIAVLVEVEDRERVVQDVKIFSFGLSAKEDENMIRKDVPFFLDNCLKRFPKVSWTALKANKANIAYDIYCKRHKGTREDKGKYWRYTCYK